jgi:hypothetical protein
MDQTDVLSVPNDEVAVLVSRCEAQWLRNQSRAPDRNRGSHGRGLSALPVHLSRLLGPVLRSAAAQFLMVARREEAVG